MIFKLIYSKTFYVPIVICINLVMYMDILIKEFKCEKCIQIQLIKIFYIIANKINIMMNLI